MEKEYSTSRLERRKQQPKRKKQQPKGGKKILKYSLLSFLFLFLILVVGGGVFFISMVSSAPDLDKKNLLYARSSTIYDMKDKRIASISGGEKRDYAPIKEIPERVRNAFIATEDVRFYKHNGIDTKRVLGAIFANITNGFGSEGASTITQQVVKNTMLSHEKTVKRKIQEAYLSIQLERKYTKDQILEIYLNKIYFGQSANGVKTAAKAYFDKSLDDLTLSEAALLAGLPQRPSGYDPFKHPDLAEKRRNVVLYLMYKNGYITKEQKEEAQNEPIEKTLVKPKAEKRMYEAFLQQVIKDAQKEGITEKELFEGGLKVYTTLDADAQEHTQDILSTNNYINYPDEKFQAGVTLLDTKTGEIRAIGGNRLSEENQVSRGFNYATDTRRQPGSTIKPVLDYGPAIEYLKWSTNQPIVDEPLEINGKQFQNWDKRYHGTLTMREALMQSYNIPAIKTFQAVGEERAKEFANKLGLGLDQVYPSYAIGGFNKGVSPLTMAGAYSAFGNEGEYHQPTTLRKVVYPDGGVQTIKKKGQRAMSSSTAYMVTDMLKSVVNEGTGTMAKIPGLPMAGKTGTTNMPANAYGDGSTDSWFVGYTTAYTCAVWTGYDNPGPDAYVRKSDQVIAKQIFRQLVGHVSQNIYTADFSKPDSVIQRGSGLYVAGTSMPAAAPKVSKPDEDKKKKEEEKIAKELEKQKKKEEEERLKAEEEKKKQEEEKAKEEEEKNKPDTPTTPPADGGQDGTDPDQGGGTPPADPNKPDDPGQGQGKPGDNKPDEPTTPPTDPETPPKQDEKPKTNDNQGGQLKQQSVNPESSTTE